jgi:branched-chain amino acid transport system ATP-binding protein
VLELEGLTTRYGAITAIRDLGLRVDEGEVVALIGPNGAGKTTTLGSIAGLLTPVAGSVRLDGEDVTGSAPDVMLRRGVALVPEHRRIFADLTVAENLQVAGVTLPAGDRRVRMDETAEVFAVLREKWGTQAGYLSGGEAQQLAVARALMTDPRLILMDEPSLGLAPALVDVVFGLIADLKAQGRTLLVVEQNARRALEVADRAYLLRTGSVVDEGTGEELLARTDLFEAYLGSTGPGL